MENYGEPRIYYGISEEISEDIPEDIPEYPKIFSEVLRINGYPRRSSETPGYPRISLWGELPDDPTRESMIILRGRPLLWVSARSKKNRRD